MFRYLWRKAIFKWSWNLYLNNLLSQWRKVYKIIKKIPINTNKEINCMTNILSCFSALTGFLSEAVARKYSVKKAFLKIWQNSQENTLKMRLWHRSCEYCEIFKNLPFFLFFFFSKHLRWLLLDDYFGWLRHL